MSTLHGEYRRHTRTDIKTDISLAFTNNELKTRTYDVSHSGLAIEKPDSTLLRPGQTINIQFNRAPHLSGPAKIVRIGKDQIGIELDHFRLTDIDIESVIRTAPLYQRIKTLTKRTIWKTTRQLAVFITNSLIRKPFLMLVKPSFIVAVYGTEKEMSAYATPWMMKLTPPLILGGIIKTKNHRGIMLATKHPESELINDPKKVKSYLSNIQKEFSHIPTIALVGRLPNFAMRARVKIAPPYVDGSMGTRYLIWEICSQMNEYPQFKNENTITILGGAGRIGNLSCQDLSNKFSTVIAFDLRYKTTKKVYTPIGKIIKTSDTNILNQSKMFVCLMPQGDAITEIMSCIPEHSIVADDTHPCISLEVRDKLKAMNIMIEKAVLTHDSFSMWPRMPAWSNRAIPGCVVETLVIMEKNDVDVKRFSAFREVAQKIGFHGKLIPPLDE